MEKTIIAGIITAIIILSSGTTLFLQSLGTKTGCRAGWQYTDQGEYEGYYGCTTLSGIRYQVCFSVYNSSNTGNYWCEKAKLVEKNITIIEEKIIINPPQPGDWQCNERGIGCKQVT